MKPRLYSLALAAISMIACGHSSNSNDHAGSGSGSGGSAATRGASTGGGSGSASDRPVPVQVAITKKQDLPIWVDGLGSVSAYMTVTVHTQLVGWLQQVLFTEGQFVKKGDVLAQVDPRPYLVALHQAEGALVRDKALKDSAQHQYERDLDMRKQNLIAQATVDTDYGQLGNYDGAVRIDQAQIESAKLNLDYAAIKAPLDGITGVRQVDPGNLVQPSDASGIVVLTAINPAAVFITIPQDDLNVVLAALARGEVPVEVWTRGDVDSAKLGDGKIIVLDNQINQTTATLRLKALVPNEKNLLWPNQFVKARVLTETRKDAITIPAVAIQHGPNGAFVYVVGNDSTVQMKPITTNLTMNELAVIDKGLAGGEQVVTEGANQLRPGARVSVTKPGADVASSASGQAPAGGAGGKPEGAPATPGAKPSSGGADDKADGHHHRGSGAGSATTDPAGPTASKATTP